MLEQSQFFELQRSETVGNVLRTPDEITNKTIESHSIELEPLPPLIRIPVKFYSISSQALVDTGAAASFIFLSLLRKIPYKKWKK